MAAILKIWYDVITLPSIVQLLRNLAGGCKVNDMPMTAHTSKSKPEIEFQYGGRPFSETGSSYISFSAGDWVISSKFGTQVDLHLLKQMPSLNLNRKVHFRLYGRHLENSIWCHRLTPLPIVRLQRNLEAYAKWHDTVYKCTYDNAKRQFNFFNAVLS